MKDSQSDTPPAGEGYGTIPSVAARLRDERLQARGPDVRLDPAAVAGLDALQFSFTGGAGEAVAAPLDRGPAERRSASLDVPTPERKTIE